MQQYIIRRSLLNVFVLLLVATMVFGALRLDSDSVVTQRAAGCFSAGDPESIERCKDTARQELGLDASLPEQYWTFMTDLVQLDFGNSFRTREPVLDEIWLRLDASVELGALQIAVALLIALPIGVISAIRQDTWIDYILRFFSIALLGIPVFVVAIISILIAGRWFGGTIIEDWFTPTGSYEDFLDAPMDNIRAIAAPALVGGLATGAIIMRFLRSQMLEVLRQDYVRTAWSKGLKERVIVVRHALKNALIPVLTLVGILLGTVIAGNVILENIYRINGIGFYVVSAAAQLDFPVVQGIVIIVATGLVFVNLFVDIMYGWLDPRIRYG
jgi:peptide/nickel transport system permease protein